MVGLGDLPGGSFYSVARGVSADGSVVVGVSNNGSPSGAFIWDEIRGMRSLREELTKAGLDLTGWTLDVATGVSDDGCTIVGWGYTPSGWSEAWIATIPEPTTLSILALGAAGILWKRRGRRSAAA